MVRESGVGPLEGLESLDVPLARGKYLLDRALFRGTRTTIYAAWHASLDRTVWIELGHRGVAVRHRSLRFRRGHAPPPARPAKPARAPTPSHALARERRGNYRTLSGLESPGLPRIFELGWDEERGPFAVMEALTGRSLTERVLLSGRRLGVVEMAFLGQEILTHLDLLHDTGRTHAELDPDHVWLPRRRGGVRIAFHPLQDEQHGGVVSRSSPYHAPEQLRMGAGVDLRTDLYRLAATLYFALTGHPPFAADDDEALDARIRRGGHAPPSAHGDFGRDLDDFFARALAADPSDRFHNVPEMGRALRLAALFHGYGS